MVADIILKDFSQIFCPNDLGHPLYGDQMNQATILHNAYIAIKDGKIVAVGEGEPQPHLIGEKTVITSYKGKVATPGLIATPIWFMVVVVNMNLPKS